MKKRALLLTFVMVLMSVEGVRAQYSDLYYHRIGDTVAWQAPNGYYQWWEFESYYQNHQRYYHDVGNALPGVNGKILQYYFTPDTLKIIGVTVAFMRYTTYNAPAEPCRQEYAYVYDAVGDSMVMKMETAWHMSDTNVRYVTYKNCVNGHSHVHGCDWPFSMASADSCCGPCWKNGLLPIHEYYFDTAIYVTDSFYVGVSNYSLPKLTDYDEYGDLAPEFQWYPLYYNYYASTLSEPCQGTEMYYQDGRVPQCSFPYLQYAVWSEDTAAYDRGTGLWEEPMYPHHQWSYIGHPSFTVVYPIVAVDTTVPTRDYCRPVENFHVALMEAGCVTVAWDDFENYTGYEVQYRSYGARYQEWTTVETGTNLFQLCDVDSNSTYYFRVRAMCDTAKKTTQWTEPLIVSIPRPVEIEEVESLLGRYVSVQPNPATEMVRVETPMELRQVEVYNARGVMVYSTRAWGKVLTIDVSDWPKGSYVVNVGTARGTTAKVLIKQ